MRKSISVILALIAMFLGATVIHAESPTDEGVYSLSGSTSYRNTDYEESDDSYSYLIGPSFLYFVADNLGIGTSLSYGRISGDGYTSTSAGIGPTIRWYLPVDTKVFVSASYFYVDGKTENHSIKRDSTRKRWSFAFGFDYFLSKNIALEPSLRYQIDDYELDFGSTLSSDDDSKTFGATIGINVFIF